MSEDHIDYFKNLEPYCPNRANFVFDNFDTIGEILYRSKLSTITDSQFYRSLREYDVDTTPDQAERALQDYNFANLINEPSRLTSAVTTEYDISHYTEDLHHDIRTDFEEKDWLE